MAKKLYYVHECVQDRQPARKRFPTWSIWSKHKQLLEKLQEAVRKVGRPAVVARQGDSEPRNNDGRRHCWWCWSWTEKRQGFTAEYDICPKCEK